MSRSKHIDLQVGDLVEPNWAYLRIKPYQTLMIVLSIEESSHKDFIRAYSVVGKEYKHVTVYDIINNRTITSLIIVNKGWKNCEYKKVE